MLFDSSSFGGDESELDYNAWNVEYALPWVRSHQVRNGVSGHRSVRGPKPRASPGKLRMTAVKMCRVLNLGFLGLRFDGYEGDR